MISKIEIVYSMVGHYSHIGSRISFYNTSGIPAGNTNYVVPHLVYEPLVTLYNPHNTELRMDRSRVQLSDPPVGFKFKKNNTYLRSEWATGDTFHGLGRFQIANESNAAVRKTFTMTLSNATVSNSPGGQIVLRPGETKTFGVWVEPNWTWGLETSGGFIPRSFFDWDLNNNFTNVDKRTNNQFGVEAIARPFVDYRAGFQTDALSVSTGRPAATLYSFEQPSTGANWVAIKTTDNVTVEAKALRTVAPSPSVPDFQLSLLRGISTNPAVDKAKSYSFNAALVTQPGVPGTGGPSISRVLGAAEILQGPQDSSLGGKKPFAVFTIVAKSTALQRRAFQATPQPAADVLYETRLTELLYYSTPETGPSDAPTAGIEVMRMERIGDSLMLDVVAPPATSQTWKVKGTADLANGFPDDLTSSSPVTVGPAGSGIYKVKVDISGRGERYFVRIEK